MSSEPPPRLSESGTGPSSASTFVLSPSFSSELTSFCTARASVWSASVHVGIPTRSMFCCIISASGLLKCRGHAEPNTRTLSSVVPVIVAAPLAISWPYSNICLMRGYSVSRK